MPAKKSLIVFDIDGTLTNSVAIHQAGFIRAMNLLGIAKMDENFHGYKHHTDLHIARTIYENTLQKQFEAEQILQFEEHLYNGIAGEGNMTEIKGARQFVAYLQQETEFGVCYATGSMQRPAQFKLEKIGIGFDALQLAAANDNEERGAIVQAAIGQAGRYYGLQQFERIISFGDGIWDLHTAQQLNLEFVGIGTRNKAAMVAAGMQVHLDDYHNFDAAFLNQAF